MTTLTINEKTKAGKVVLELVKILTDAGSKGIEINNPTNNLESPELSPKDEAFLKTLKRSAKHAKEIGAGTRKGKPLQELLDEL